MKVKYFAAVAAASVFGLTALTSCGGDDTTELDNPGAAEEVAPEPDAAADPGADEDGNPATDEEADPCAADPCAGS